MSKSTDLLVGIAGLATGGIMLMTVLGMPESPQFFPRFVSVFILLVSAIIIVEAFMKMKKSGGSASSKKPVDYKSVLAVIGILIAYYITFQMIGYTIPTFLLIFLTALVLGYRNWKVLIITSAAISVGLYLIFTMVFGIRFPGIFY